MGLVNHRTSVLFFTVYFILTVVVPFAHSHEEIDLHSAPERVMQAPDIGTAFLFHPEGAAPDANQHNTHHGEHSHFLVDADGNLIRIRDGVKIPGILPVYSVSNTLVLPVTSPVRSVTTELIPRPRDFVRYLHTGLSPPLS